VSPVPRPAPLHRAGSAPPAPAGRVATTLAVVLAIAFAIGLGGCGSSHPSQRSAVASYIRKLDRIEVQLKAPLVTVTHTGTQLAASPRRATLLGNLAQASNQQALVSALRRIRGLEASLRAVAYPATARHLRSLVLTLTAGEADLTEQLRLLSQFLPRFGAALTPLGPATLALERVLSQRSAYGTTAVAALFAAKAKALRSFQATAARIAARLDRLHPPRVSIPEYRAELTSLHGMSSTSGRLAAALAGGAPGNVSSLLSAFDRAAAATHAPAVARAQIKAIKAYNASTTRLSGLSQAIASERLRLSNTLS
jgi:hypothetical protein